MSLKTLSRIFIFVLITTMNVRVRALAIEEPRKCVKSGDDRCAVFSETWLETLPLSSAVVKLSRGATVERESASSLKLMRGLVKVKADASTTVKTLYGDLEFAQGEVLVEAAGGVVKFTNLSSDLKYTPRGEGSSHALPIGFSTYFTRVNKSGVAETGYPKPAEIEKLIRDWSRFYSKSEKRLFSDDLRKFMMSWEVVTKQVGPWYVDVVKREIAAHEEEEARLARLRAAQAEENNMYKNMFRKRIFGE